MEEKILQALAELSNQFDSLRKDVNSKLSNLENKVDALQIQTKENTEILKSLVHSAEVNKAEHDRMDNDIAHIKGELESIREILVKVGIVTSSNWNEIDKLNAIK
ncbi:hypothetical protein [Acetivibrio clariflavus]|uniref:Uncharacterized protein n=1 Tax=Acetivibrio clariflavus (strain DSM 19732 / NBRC 101661 / EBR45) TaxID=720554 RepID=G8LX88_ACECE|nr:hypothetical protein [Acetivibrio clariflavus]AEV68779.1 hypothetical protein Clocl_2186 [Acetivibrio clariflavus DSM 19732]